MGFWHRVFVEERLRASGAVTDEVEDDFADLQQILALGKKEAAEIVSEVTSRAYRQVFSLMLQIPGTLP